ncbi:MAG TPA: hypothetical protein VFS40_00775 [Gemmatimonadales bacterium]|nr:hypothetical protein [Gemmatimonadales bacterium]
MPVPTLRAVTREQREPAVHDLEPLRGVSPPVLVRISVRQDEYGGWRGRLHFAAEDPARGRETAEIFCAATEQELWQSVFGLRDHHLRDLYRSLG